MPRPIEHVLDSIFYSNLKRSGVGNDEMDDSVPRSKDWDPFASTDTFMGEERESDDDDDDETKTSRRRRAGLDWLDDDGNEIEDSDEQKQRNKDWDDELDDDESDSKKSSRRSNLDNFGDKKAPPFGSKDVDDDVDEFYQGGDKERAGGTGGYNDPSESKKKDATIHTAPGGGAHGPYHIEDSGGSYRVVNDNGETKGTHDTYDQAREQQKALYVNVPEAQEQAKEKSSRRRLADSNILYNPHMPIKMMVP